MKDFFSDPIYYLLALCATPWFQAWLAIGFITGICWVMRRQIRAGIEAARKKAGSGAQAAQGVLDEILQLISFLLLGCVMVPVYMVRGLVQFISAISRFDKFLLPRLIAGLFGLSAVSGLIYLAVASYHLAFDSDMIPAEIRMKIIAGAMVVYAVGLIVLRIWCELAIIAFSFYERVVDIRNELRRANGG